ncbi:MAG: bifunctional (p)ppGpp synthetase/guanosine-3',5'-bis(diphosphate) 3'-pyrophosphohydrolase [Deltaproteobacteria bacterium]|nr:bifunctional (p)ppGpp synthetase/guanosine-3',5'-bis(diphosphate) 3'-pyrophosphohydrolase [Deltaproteobacteria bacterium]
MVRLNDIISKVESYQPSADLDLIRRAYVFSAKAHQGQVRKSGDPYLIHPLEVAELLADMRLDAHAICAGILHDTVEDTETTVKDLEVHFGKDVADIVDGVTKLNIPFNTAFEKQAENFRRMLVAMAQDIRVILVKLADRLHNMRTLEHMKPEKQELIAKETLEIYAPLANRLGIYWLKAALEDLCLQYLHPKDWKDLQEKLAATAKNRAGYIEEVQGILEEKMKEGGVPCQVKGRVKHLYSIWRKLKTQSMEFEQVNDIIAFRVITDDITHCYQALGICHATWRPVPGRIKDFVAMPKPNGYRSLHTTVIGPDVQRVEIQIRTEDMDDVAEHGIAAHWAYKEGKPSVRAGDEQFAWLRQLMEWQKEFQDPADFISTVKVDLFADEVYVFTPRGEVKELKRGSTPVDFAYLIHTEVGNHCTGARVNGRIVPLKYRLKNGDTVDIMTAPHQKPNKDWLNFVKTAKARTRINAYLRKEQRRRAVEMGKELLDKEAKRYGRSLQKILKSNLIDKAVESSRFPKAEDLIAAVGYGKVKPLDVLKKCLPEDVIDKGPQEDKKPKSGFGKLLEAVTKRSKSQSGVSVAGIDDMLVRFAKCCSPVPGDPIVGFVTRGRGITVHAIDCEKALALDPERKVDVSWDATTNVARSVELRVITDDKPGILATMSQAFSSAGVNILNANCRARKDSRAINMFMVTVSDAKQLRKVMKEIENLSGVHSVERVSA